MIFAVLATIAAFALYSFHRIFLLSLWLKYRNQEPVVPDGFDGSHHNLPHVTVQLPLYNELFVAERLIRSAAELDYPVDKLEIQVLDDSSDETRELVDRVVGELREAGTDIVCVRRPNRDGFKAGALSYGLKRAKGSLVAVFDSDFLIPHDFLDKTVPHFHDSKVGMVQTRWEFINESQSFLTKAQSLSLRAHFRVEHLARARSGRFFNFNGTAGIWRSETIDAAGGWQGDTLTEDLDLSYRAQLAGWKFVYLDDVTCLSEVPPTFKAFKTQQHRWMKGMAQVARKLLPVLIRSDVAFKVKAEAFFHFFAPVTYSFTLASFLLLLPLTLIYGGASLDWLRILFAVVLGWTTCSVAVFHYASDRNRPAWNGLLDFAMRFFYLLVVGIGNSLNGSRAVFEGFMGWQSPFVRTPKYGELNLAVNDTKDKTVASTFKYVSSLDPLVAGEVVLLVYAAVTVLAASLNCWAVVPWSALFFVGCAASLGSQLSESVRGSA